MKVFLYVFILIMLFTGSGIADSQQSIPVSIDWNFEGNKLLWGMSDGQIFIWDADTGDLNTIQMSTEVFVTKWRQDGKYFSVGDIEGKITIWDANTLELFTELLTPGPPYYAVISLDWIGLDKVVSGNILGTVVITSLNGDFIAESSVARPSFVDVINYIPQSNSRIVIFRSGIYIWDYENNQIMLEIPNLLVYEGEIAPIGDKIVGINISYNRTSILIWDANTGILLTDFSIPYEIDKVKWSHDGTKLATIDKNGLIQVWDITTHEEIARFIKNERGLIAWDESGRSLAYIGSNNIPEILLLPQLELSPTLTPSPTATPSPSLTSTPSPTHTLTPSPTATLSPDALAQYVLFAQEGMWLKQEVQVSGGSIGVNMAGSAPFLSNNASLSLDNGVVLSGGSAYGDSVHLAQNAQVPQLFANRVSGNGTILSETQPYTAPLAQLPALPTFTAGAGEIRIARDQTLELPAGEYGRLITERSTLLKLTGGIYTFRSWELGNTTLVLTSTPSEVRIVEGIRAGDNIFLGAETGTNGSLSLQVAGANERTRPAIVRFGNDATFIGRLYAPNGTVEFANRASVRGQVVARWVVVGQGGEVVR